MAILKVFLILTLVAQLECDRTCLSCQLLKGEPYGEGNKGDPLRHAQQMLNTEGCDDDPGSINSTEVCDDNEWCHTQYFKAHVYGTNADGVELGAHIEVLYRGCHFQDVPNYDSSDECKYDVNNTVIEWAIQDLGYEYNLTVAVDVSEGELCSCKTDNCNTHKLGTGAAPHDRQRAPLLLVCLAVMSFFVR